MRINKFRGTQQKKSELRFQEIVWHRRKVKLNKVKMYRYGEILRRFLKFNQNKILVDVGCGFGSYGVGLAKNGYNVIGMDISRMHIKSAKKLSSTEKVNLSLILCDAEQIALANQSVDICFCNSVLHHFKDIRLVGRELSRILKEGGLLWIDDTNGSNPIIKLLNIVVHVFLPKSIYEKHGLYSPNERTHTVCTYIKTLRKYGFTILKILLVNKTYRTSTNFLLKLYGRFLCYIARKLLFPFRGTNVVIISIR